VLHGKTGHCRRKWAKVFSSTRLVQFDPQDDLLPELIKDTLAAVSKEFESIEKISRMEGKIRETELESPANEGNKFD
jgi:hypothetical protein